MTSANDNHPMTGRELDAAVRGWTDEEILERLAPAPLDDDRDVSPMEVV